MIWWIDELQTFGITIGEYTGREKQLESITVSTYDSAYNHTEDLGNRFKLVLFNEAHHLAAEGYRHIAKFFASLFRMGLTATYEREDEKHEAVTELLGGKMYEIETEELTGEYLAEQHHVEPAAIRRYMDNHYPGTISNDRYVPEVVLDTIKEDVAAVADPILAAVAPILERYSGAQHILETIGYTVHYTSLNQEEAEVRRDV